MDDPDLLFLWDVLCPARIIISVCQNKLSSLFSYWLRNIQEHHYCLTTNTILRNFTTYNETHGLQELSL